MAENETVMDMNGGEPDSTIQPESKWQKFKAGAKEWLRKKVVGLKRAPQNIPFIFMVITSFLYLIWLFTFSKSISTDDAEWTGIVVFVNTLLSILLLALYFSAFPKRKKPNIVFIVLMFVFMAVLIGLDVVYYILLNKNIHNVPDYNEYVGKFPYLVKSLNLAIAHIVLVGICAILLATLPLYKKLIMKINTKKVIESNDLKEEIDTSAEV